MYISNTTDVRIVVMDGKWYQSCVPKYLFVKFLYFIIIKFLWASSIFTKAVYLLKLHNRFHVNNKNKTNLYSWNIKHLSDHYLAFRFSFNFQSFSIHFAPQSPPHSTHTAYVSFLIHCHDTWTSNSVDQIPNRGSSFTFSRTASRSRRGSESVRRVSRTAQLSLARS